jgi:hypothetical protein
MYLSVFNQIAIDMTSTYCLANLNVASDYEMFKRVAKGFAFYPILEAIGKVYPYLVFLDMYSLYKEGQNGEFSNAFDESIAMLLMVIKDNVTTEIKEICENFSNEKGLWWSRFAAREILGEET